VILCRRPAGRGLNSSTAVDCVAVVSYLHPEYARLLLDETPSAPAGEGTAGDSYALLSPREPQVMRLIALGHTNQQVARMLGLSVKTVETYKSRLMTKLGLAGRAALVRYALQRGLLEEPE
jgi:two-component system response regulator NreC